MSTRPQSIASRWFEATEALGDFVGIRFGRLAHGSDEIEWFHVSHRECDGVGGFARLLRQRGAAIPQLPSAKTPCRGVIGPLWRLWRDSRRAPECAVRADWLPAVAPAGGPPKDLAWHFFSEAQTREVIEACRRQQVTVNSLLLKHLDASVRPELGISGPRLPWMVPINLRGGLRVADDTENQVSCLEVLVAPDDSVSSVHRQILDRLARGEHRAKFLLMEMGRFLSHERRMRYLASDRSKPAGNIGAFSNLGSWDPEKRIDSREAWLFCPPVVTGQRLAAGCVTFQNRLSLMLHAHPDPFSTASLAKPWMHRWAAKISGE